VVLLVVVELLCSPGGGDAEASFSKMFSAAMGLVVIAVPAGMPFVRGARVPVLRAAAAVVVYLFDARGGEARLGQMPCAVVFRRRGPMAGL
jgi:hypothetical protein